MIWKEERKRIFKKIEALDNVIHVLEATANTYYSPNQRMWKILLSTRTKLRMDIDDEKKRLYNDIQVKDKEHKIAFIGQVKPRKRKEFLERYKPSKFARKVVALQKVGLRKR